ncbi:TonB-dependent receptor [Thalassotalea sp. LPB0316]|uniref:TonB-dependent receptor n=1 Tax=Thalassotalea sp. LPB0316 TaxID=2769490 RepID=UPI001866DEC0|nr:TonB-dependent receptor [Thalassotalea sp. LPB0316]QOL26773.1 TonB-dependent receptor [Thalassotalea sp. LPB0316]
MLKFKPSKVTLAMLSTGLMAMSAPVLAAQDSQAKEQEVEVITVTGIRGSLQRAQAIKMSTDNIVEVISAEDIGKLPDTSVAESLSRLPGVTGERRNGRTSGLAVRGFNENYVGTTLNGREILGMGDNRGVEFDLYPTEIINNIVVYKSSEAGLTTQGIGGTIDMQMVSPLTAEKTMTFNASYEKNAEDAGNPDYDNKGHRLSFNFVDKFADDTIGVALTVADQETPRQENQFRGWGYADSSQAPGAKILGGHDSYTRSALLERTSVAGVVEWAPTDRLKVKLDALYIDFEENDVKRGLEEGGAEWGAPNHTAGTVENGLVMNGEFDGFHSVIRNDGLSQKAELNSLGLNVEYALSDNWTFAFDYSGSDVEKELLDVESYSGVGRAGVDGRPTIARSWQQTSTGAMFGDHSSLPTLDYTDPNLIRLAGPQAWGAPVVGSDAQDGFINRPNFNEELDAVRFSVDGVVEWGIISAAEFGLHISDRKKTKINEGDYLTAPSYPGDAAIPDVLGVADLSFIGINGVLAYDSLGLYRSGYYNATEASLVQTDRLGDTYTVEEDIRTWYAKFSIDTEWQGVYVTGNFGVQYTSVEQSSFGFSTVENENGYVEATPVEGNSDYADLLPTMNLSFEIAENQFIRTAAGKVLSRPRMDQMKPNNVATFAYNDDQINNPNPERGPWSGNAGNPNLKPLEAVQFDLSYENYFSPEGYFAATFFYKDLKNWHRSNRELVDFSDVYIPELHQDSEGNAPATLFGFVNTEQDGLEGFVRGYEFQTSLPFNIMHDSLEGLGVVMSATFIDGKLDDGGRIPGLSEESYSLTAYYEINGWEFRIAGTKRDEFLTETRGLSLALEETEDLGGQLWDAQISYDFSESSMESLHGLRVSFQAQNLTDEDTVQAEAVDPRQITKYQSFGANYMLSMNYKF